jgi:hypothetical protein
MWRWERVVSGVAGFSLGTRFSNAMKEMMQMSTNREIVPRTSEGLLDMVTDDDCGCGGICDVGVMGSLLLAEVSQVCLLLSQREWQTLCHRRLRRGLACWEVK